MLFESERALFVGVVVATNSEHEAREVALLKTDEQPNLFPKLSTFHNKRLIKMTTEEESTIIMPAAKLQKNEKLCRTTKSMR